MGLETGFFYPGELVEVLGVERIDYRQLRILLALVRGVEPGKLPRSWAQYSLPEVAGMRLALELCGAYTEQSSTARRYLRLSPLEKACAALRSIGIENPLLEVPLVRHGSRIIAKVNGLLVDPTNGQLILGSVRDLILDAIEGTPGEAAAKASLRNQYMEASSKLDAAAGGGRATLNLVVADERRH